MQQPRELAADVAQADHQHLHARQGFHVAMILPRADLLVIAVGMQTLHQHQQHRQRVFGDGLAIRTAGAAQHGVGQRGFRFQIIRRHARGIELQQPGVFDLCQLLGL